MSASRLPRIVAIVDHERHAEQRREVLAEGGIHGQESHTRVVEHAFGDDGSAHDGAQRQAQQRDDRDDGVAQPMDVEHSPRGGALGPGRADEVLCHRLHHGRPHVAAERGDADSGEGDHRQHEAARVGEDPPEAVALRRFGRKDRDVDGEPQDEQGAEQERRHRVEHEGDARDDVVLGLVTPDHLVDAEGDGDDEGEQRRQTDEQQGLGQGGGDQRRHRLVERVRAAEVKAGQVPHVMDELVPQRQVQAVLFLETLDSDRLGPWPEYGPRLTAGDEMDEDEHDGDDPEDHHHGLQEPSNEEAGHESMVRLLPTRDRLWSRYKLPLSGYFFT